MSKNLKIDVSAMTIVPLVSAFTKNKDTERVEEIFLVIKKNRSQAM